MHLAPLSSTRILDLSRLLPGPYATLLLTDLGAEVVKVETPRLGDYARQVPPEIGGDTMFRMINRGKKSLALNYRNKKGREIFLHLAESADVIVETFKPGAVDRWGIGYEAVRAVNPSIVYCSLSGYGQSGPYRDRPGHDINYIALGGLLGLTGEPGQIPTPPAIQTADLAGATFAALNILAALLERGRSGEGRFLDVAMLDPIVHWLMPTVGAQFFSTEAEPRRGRLPLTGGWPCNRVYGTSDGKFLTLGALEPPFWSEFCRVTERPDLLPRAFDGGAIPEVAAIFASKTAAEWLESFSGLDVPLEPVLTLPEVLEDPQVKSRGLIIPSQDGSPPQLRSPFPFQAAEGEAPRLGEHTRQVLSGAGYSEDELLSWEEKGLIRSA